MLLFTKFCTFIFCVCVWTVMCCYCIGFLWIFSSVVSSGSRCVTWVGLCLILNAWMSCIYKYEFLKEDTLLFYFFLCNPKSKKETRLLVYPSNAVFSPLNLIIHSCTKTSSCPLKNNNGCWLQMHNSPMYNSMCVTLSYIYIYKAYTGQCHIKGDTTDLLLN